jgi:hypothetical protein
MINGVRCHEHGCPNQASDAKRQERNRRARINRKARHELMMDCGLVRGKDSMGRVIYE